MYQHPTEQQLTEYQQRMLAPDIFLAVHEHVTECARCAARCYEPRQSRTDYEMLLAALTPAADDAPYHLTRETAAAYVADKLDVIDREPVVSHLEVCAECAAMVERLHALPSASPAAQPPAISVVERHRARSWARPWPVSLAQQFRPLTLAVAALLVVVLLVIAVLLLRARNTQHANLVRPSTPPTNDNAQTPPAPSPQSNSAQAQAVRTVLTLNDGGQQITLDEQGNLAGLEQLPEQVRRLVRSALVTQQLARPAVLADLNPQPSTLLGTSDNTGLPFHLLAPLGVVLESDQPTFRWQPLAGADTYTITVTDEGLNEVASSGPLSATAWHVPRPLARGTTYSWQVTARRSDGQTVTSPALPAPPAKFQVLAHARFEELQRVRRAYPAAHLTLGVLYAQAGLTSEAAREFQSLVRANPQSDVARKLLRSAQINARRR